MKKIIFSLSLLLALMLSPRGFAQSPPPAPATNEAGAPHQHPHFLDQLDLTDDQKAKIKQIHDTVSDRQEAHEQIAAVLTPEQRAKLRQLREDWRKSHPDEGQHWGGGQ